MMNDDIHVDQVELKTAGLQHAESGLLGWLTFRVNRAIRLDGITLRRTADGDLALSFPAKRDGAGRKRPYVQPLSDAARVAIEHQVFTALGLRH